MRQRDRDYDVHDPALRGDAPKPHPDDVLTWPDGTTATRDDVERGGYTYMSDDYTVTPVDAPNPAPWHGKDLPDGRDLKAREHVKPCLYCKHWTQFLTRYDAGLCEVGAKGKGAPAVDYLDTCDRHTPR